MFCISFEQCGGIAAWRGLSPLHKFLKNMEEYQPTDAFVHRQQKNRNSEK